jgi:hypothetical protein
MLSVYCVLLECGIEILYLPLLSLDRIVRALPGEADLPEVVNPRLHQRMRSCCLLLLQYLIQSCARGGRRTVEDRCYEIRRAEACVD